jgi:hypothetical protein
MAEQLMTEAGGEERLLMEDAVVVKFPQDERFFAHGPCFT